MPEVVTLEARVVKLERELRLLRVSFVVIVLILLTLPFVLAVRTKESLWTDSLIVPSGYLGSSKPFAGLAPSKDGREIVLWFAQQGGSFAQTRLGFESTEQALTFVDAQAKLRVWIGIAPNREAKIRILDGHQNEVWSAPAKTGGG
jgi:hypothetical protein